MYQMCLETNSMASPGVPLGCLLSTQLESKRAIKRAICWACLIYTMQITLLEMKRPVVGPHHHPLGPGNRIYRDLWGTSKESIFVWELRLIEVRLRHLCGDPD